MRILYCLSLICCSFWLSSSSKIVNGRDNNLKVCTPHMGCIQGKYMLGYDIAEFEAFIGVPFALPPVNELRFQSPKPMPKFKEVYNATTIKPDCIQINLLLQNPSIEGSEDCLYLNVYRPKTSISKHQLPVMVYIYGGGWFGGSSSPLTLGPEYLMDTKEVVLVTLNYRVGPMGFLSTHDENIPGNSGLKDQVLALQWVQKNIAYFGGDPNSVTIFGQSAGGCNAQILALSETSKGLFHKFIAMSGTANIPYVFEPNPLAQARKLGKLSNIKNVERISTQELARALKQVDAQTLVGLTTEFITWDIALMGIFRPVVESANVKDAILTEDVNDIINKGTYDPRPWMVSFVKNEGAIRASIIENEKLKSSFNSQFERLIEEIASPPKNLNAAQKDNLMKFVVDKYFKGQHSLNDDNQRGLINFYTDRGFFSPMYNAIESYVNSMPTSKFPVYVLNFNFKGPYSYIDVFASGKRKNLYGVIHCDDLVYLFRSPSLFPDFPKNSTDASVMRAFVKNFVSFAKRGKPQSPQRPCDKDSFEKNGFCEYQQFQNVGNSSFEVRLTNTFDVTMMKEWNVVLDNKD